MKYKYKPDKSRPSVYIFDIDGTLADMGKRHPYDFDKVDEDTLIEPVADMLRSLAEKNQIVLLTGRNEVCRDKTMQWLKDNNILYNQLLMRNMGDVRKDAIMKQHFFEEELAPYYNVLGVFDDRDICVKMWREIGLTCYQPAYGNF